MKVAVAQVRESESRIHAQRLEGRLTWSRTRQVSEPWTVALRRGWESRSCAACPPVESPSLGETTIPEECHQEKFSVLDAVDQW